MTRKFIQRLRSCMHLVRISQYARPTQIPDLVHNFRWVRPAVGQIAAMEDQIGSVIPQVPQDSLQAACPGI